MQTSHQHMKEHSNFNSKGEKYSMGKARDGTLFRVPETHDMVRSLFDPLIKKSLSDYLIVASLILNGAVFYYTLHSQWQIPVFLFLYGFWRLGYNFGIGFLLYQQSHYEKLFTWFKSVETQKSIATSFMNSELKSKLTAAQLGEVPMEFKTWIVFRSLVSLILMNDFVTYVLLVLSCSSRAFDQETYLVVVRWGLGIILFVFNLVVKLDAHNVVKDYAWYWGDFFFRLHNNEELIFDGVFDLAPHPMYSIGYSGYYGFALMTQSYTVLFASIAGHLMQFLFLKYVEDPHISKIYGPGNIASESQIQVSKRDDLVFGGDGRPLVLGGVNFNPTRASDYFTVLLVVYSGIMPIFLPFSPAWNRAIAGYALVVKVVSSLVISGVLYNQSRFKSLSRRFITRALPFMRTVDPEHLYQIECSSFKSWCVLYNNLTLLTYSSLFALCVRDWMMGFSTNWLVLKVTLFSLLVLGQLAVNKQIISALGNFGWFYGDFFIGVVSPETKNLFQKVGCISNLSRSGVYHYLNNPERITSTLSVWATVLLFNQTKYWALAIIWTAFNLINLNLIEKPHMIKLYGEQNVKDYSAGIERSINQLFLPQSVQRYLLCLNNSVEKLISDTSRIVDDFMVAQHEKRSKLSVPTDKVVRRGSGGVFDRSGHEIPLGIESHHLLNLEAPQNDNSVKYFNFGDPITVKWKAPSSEKTAKAWIGLYKITNSGSSRSITKVSSQGHWCGVNSASDYETVFPSEHCRAIVSEYKNGRSEGGEVVFSNKLLYWESGAYEFRMHHNQGHHVVMISEPFEIRYPAIEIPDEPTDSFSQQVFDAIVKRVFPEVESYSSPWQHVLLAKDNSRRLDLMKQTLSRSLGIKVGRPLIVHEHNCADFTKKLVSIKNLLDSVAQ